MKIKNERRWSVSFTLAAGILVCTAAMAQNNSGQAKRPMSFMDVMGMRNAGSPAISPDGKWMLYTVAVPDWKAAKSYTDIYLVSMEKGVASTRQMTFTKDKNETSPKWSRDGRFFVFASNREAPASGGREGASSGGREGAGREENQLYMMRPDGGEARKITEAKDGVGTFAFSRDGKWLAFSAGKPDDQHIWIMSAAGIETEAAKPLSMHVTPVTWWQFSPDSRRVYFLSPESVDKSNKERIEKKFDVRLRNQDSPVVHLWAVDLDTKKETRLTSGQEYTVSNVTISKDSKWIGFHGTPDNRYMRTVTEAPIYADVYLLDTGSGNIERLTDNKEIEESALSFSPDSTMIAFAADDDFTYFKNRRIYVRPVSDRGGKWKKLCSNFDGDAGIGFWSNDGKKLYFNGGHHATEQLFAVSVASGDVTQVSDVKGVVTVTQDEDTGSFLVHYSDPAAPADYYTAASVEAVGGRSGWKRLTDANPQVRGLELGETEAVQWKSSDGRMVEGVLVKPVGYEKGKRYPLIVQIHGGPAGASMLGFSGNYGNYSNVFAGAGYACLLPNYRGSTNYGEKFKTEISRDYFRLGYDDIMSGVDYLIANGIADPDKMGVMGWSAGGHWSNWILTHTHRFKAISTGAGAMNWISMYAESDIQRNREFYYGGQPYDNFEHYWDVSPLKYIKFAQTPTLIHVVDGDPRVPRPQSEELHMALKKLGVPTEFLVYPGNTHGIPDPRNQMVKMVAEFNWFEKWIRGKQGWFDWKDLTQTLKDDKPEELKRETADR